jgi:hypothetical protein
MFFHSSLTSWNLHFNFWITIIISHITHLVPVCRNPVPGTHCLASLSFLWNRGGHVPLAPITLMFYMSSKLVAHRQC